MNSDNYDRMISALKGLPDVTETKPTTLRVVTPLIGASQAFIIQTFRQREIGDHIFIDIAGGEGLTRVCLPPAVAVAIARQRESLTGKVRSKTAKRVMAERIRAGFKPTFSKPKHGKKKAAK